MKKLLKSKLFKSRVFKPAAACVCAAVVICLVYFVLRYFSAPAVDYYIKNDAAGSVRISVTVSRLPFAPFAGRGAAEFFLCAYQMTGVSCVDENGTRVDYTARDGRLAIDMGNRRAVNFSYGVSCPPAASVTAFSGEEALIVPADGARRLEFRGDSYDGASAVFPYARLDNPSWLDLYGLNKSCFCFGNFRRYSPGGGVSLFVEQSADKSEDQDIAGAVRAVDLYYQGVFGKSGAYSLIITGRDKGGADNAIVGGRSIMLPFDIGSAEDCKALCHSLFYPYFDTSVSGQSYRFPPNLWLNRGLATYYGVLALDALPRNMRDSLSLNSADGFNELYVRYLYFQIKEPFTYNATPGDESAAGRAAGEFYYYTKAPLVVADIENRTGGKNALLKNMIGNAGDGYTVSKLMGDTLGASASDILDCLNGKKLVPAPIPPPANDPVRVMRAISDYELTLASWQRVSSPDYPVETLYPLDPIKVLDTTNSLGVTFGDGATESAVRDYSMTLYVLLRQYALRAYVCNLSMDDPTLRFDLAQSGNVQNWERYIQDNGLEVFDDAGGR